MKVYLVHGSEDGTLGIYSTPTKAVTRLSEYFANSWVEDGRFDGISKRNAAKYMADHFHRFFDCKSGGIHGEIEAFYIDN